MKTKNYLNKVSQHLYKIENPSEDTRYQKVIIEGDNFKVLRFNEDLQVVSDKIYPISRYEAVSPKGKEYVPMELKNGLLFWKGFYNANIITTVPHFKRFKESLALYEETIGNLTESIKKESA